MLPPSLKVLKEFREATNHLTLVWESSNLAWKVPGPGLIKVKFDGGKLGSSGKGWVVVGHASSGIVAFIVVKQSPGLSGSDFEEVNVCLFALQQALAHGCKQVLVEGESSSAISTL